MTHWLPNLDDLILKLQCDFYLLFPPLLLPDCQHIYQLSYYQSADVCIV